MIDELNPGDFEAAFREIFDSQKTVAVLHGFKVFKDSINSPDDYLNIKSKVEHKYGLFNKIKFDVKSYTVD